MKSLESTGYRSMLKATSTLAGAKLVAIFVSILRTKVLAVILGPSGMGAINLVVSSTDFTRILLSFGLESATARKAAEASATGAFETIDHAYRTSARTAIYVGSVAALVLFAISPLLAERLLGDGDRYWWFALGALSLVFTPLLGVQLAFLQGLRQTKALAACQILASLSGAGINVALVAAFGVIGGLFAMAPITLLSLAIHYRFLRHHLPVPREGRKLLCFKDTTELLKLGSGFAINSIWLAASGWLNIMFIGHYFGQIEGAHQVGLYAAASTLSNVYIGILVSAMASEFYPALVQAARDRVRLKTLLNQQTMLAITLGIPATMGLMISGFWVLELLYSREFLFAANLMQWMLAAMAIRFASCPLGFTLLAVATPRLIAISELAMGIVTIFLSYLLLQVFGLTGIGMAMCGANLLYLVGVVCVTFRMGIHWSPRVFWVIAETILAIAVCLWASIALPGWKGFLCGCALISLYAIHLLEMIRTDTGLDLSQILRKILPWKNA